MNYLRRKTTATAFRTSPKSPNCGGTISQCVLSVPSTHEPLFMWQHKIRDEKWSTCENNPETTNRDKLPAAGFCSEGENKYKV